VESIGLSIVYRSLADLSEDHRGHLMQGRMVIAWSDPSPAVGARLEVRLEVPGGGTYDLAGAVTKVAEGRGFALELGSGSQAVVGALEQLVSSHSFQQALRVESPSTRNSRKVSRRDVGPRAGPSVPAASTTSARPPARSAPAARLPEASGEPSAGSVARIAPASTPARGSLGLPTPEGARPSVAPAAATPPARGLPAASGPTSARSLPAASAGGGSYAAPAPPTMSPAVAPAPVAATAAPSGGVTAARAGGVTIAAASTVSARPPVAAPPAAHARDDDDALDDDDSDAPIDRYDDYDDHPYDDDDDGDPGSTTSDDDEEATAFPKNFRTPNPGEKYVVYVVKVKTVLDLVELIPTFRQTATLVVPFAMDPATEGDLAQLRLTLPGRNIFLLWALIGRVRPTDVTLHVNPESKAYAQALAFPKSVLGARRMSTERQENRGPLEVIRLEEERPRESEKDMPVRRRLARMSMEDKINMALSGTREERMALAMDGNKAIHHYLLKNARISLDEVAFIARLPTMNPDVLGKIAENPSYTQNLQVVKHLVYNPKTPVPVAIKLLDRLPRPEIMLLAKRMSMNQRLVQAAKKKIEGPSR
jgi:hypothetical protein